MPDTLFESVWGATNQYMNVFDVNWYASKVVASSNHSVTSIDIRAKKVGAPPTFTIAIYANGDNKPTGSPLVSNTFAPNTVLGTDDTEINITLSSTDLTSGTTYWVVLSGAGADSSNYVKWASDGTGNGGASGDSGSTWTINNVSATYRIYGILGTIDYTITCSQGSYILSGQVLTILKALRAIIEQGTYTLTGFTNVMHKGYTIVCSYGSFTLTGISNAMTKALRVAMEYGSFTLTGIVMLFQKTLTMVMSCGYFTLTGVSLIVKGLWSLISKSASSWSNRTKNNSTFSNRSKNSSSWTNRDKS